MNSCIHYEQHTWRKWLFALNVSRMQFGASCYCVSNAIMQSCNHAIFQQRKLLDETLCKEIKDMHIADDSVSIVVTIIINSIIIITINGCCLSYLPTFRCVYACVYMWKCDFSVCLLFYYDILLSNSHSTRPTNNFEGTKAD